jgi:aryl-alcohol dehydrogenase-like predicted oxidoreductase
LKRLQTDHVDLYQLHWPNRGSYHFRKYWTYDATKQNPSTMDQEVADMLGEVSLLQKEGKLREFGLSNESAWGTRKFVEVAERNKLPRVVSIQNEYSLICRIFDLDLAEVSINDQVGLLAFSPLAAGALSGKYISGDIPAGSRRSMQAGLNGRYTDQSEMVIGLYDEVAKKHGLDLGQMALAFCLTRPFMTSVIIGATSMGQLMNNIAAKDLVLSQDVMADIQAVYKKFPIPM